MKNNKGKILIPIFAFVVAGSTLFGVSTLVHAQTANSPFAGLAQSIATKFKLNPSDVQNAINAYMQQQKESWQQQIQAMQKKKLDQLVSQGKITSEQETAILAELTTVQSQFSAGSQQNLKSTHAFQSEKNILTTWANSQVPNINPLYVIPLSMNQKRGGNKTLDSPTPTP